MKQYLNKISLVRLIADLSVVAFTYILSIYIVQPDAFTSSFKAKFFLLVMLLFVWLFSGTSNKLYGDHRIKPGFSLEIYKTLKGIVILALTVVVVSYFSNTFLPTNFVLIYTVLLVVCFSTEKYIINRFVLFLRKQGYNLRHVIILGCGGAATQFKELIVNNPHLGYDVIGYFDDQIDDEELGPYLGKMCDVGNFINHNRVNEVIVATPGITISEIEQVTNLVDKAGIRIRIIPDFHFQFYNRYEFKQFGNIPTVSLRKEPLEETHNKFTKRTFDIVFSLLVLVFICSWLVPLIALLIKTGSKGPVLFKQKRLGRDRKEFWCLKFRSMYVNKESDAKMASKGDSRVTPIGRILRKTSLDEFPQFWNVLKGDMSIVGPRPHMTIQNAQYQEIINNYLVRQLIKPGITGWAQVNGYRGEIETEQDIKNRVSYDIWYLENWSFFLDIKIVYLTVWNIFKGEDKAY
ncbi:undecaprenyl-phosphate glucose phosphotransferase [Flavobacterium sp. RHBU_24]|uniref:undecaprenyl-phosphate glucose phosphotransferase n=1 Tax=Flavobacterium sp. RHBU_24 TaxID=3391185 RepID=UPI003984F0C3